MDGAHLDNCVEEDYAHVWLDIVSSFYHLPLCFVDQSPSRNIIIHFHGGGFFSGSPIALRNITTNLCIHTKSDVICPSYSLAPEYPFPYCLIDCLATYMYIEETFDYNKGIILTGDSAGGNLALSLIHLLKFIKYKLPIATVVHSPVTSFLDPYKSMYFNSKTDFLFFPNTNLRVY